MHNTITAAAGSVAAALSTALLGRQVITQKWGLFQGGLCTVIELAPDENAPEIVLQVRHDETGDEVGIFADEMICLVCEDSKAVFAEAGNILHRANALSERLQQQNTDMLDMIGQRLAPLERQYAAKHGGDELRRQHVELVSILREIVIETMDNPPVKPHSVDSYLPPALIAKASAAVIAAGGVLPTDQGRQQCRHGVILLDMIPISESEPAGGAA